MKLRSHRLNRTGDRTILHARWTDRMKRPANVKLVFERGLEDFSDVPAADGDIKDVSGALFGFAEIAWSMGWRPRGLMGNLARYVETYKEPPADR